MQVILITKFTLLPQIPSPFLPNTMSATATYHKDTYPSISPNLTHLSTTGKSAFVTGADAGAGGIGGAIATSLALSGISTIGLLGRFESRLLETPKNLQQIASKTLAQIYIADLTDRPAVQRAVTSFAATIPCGTIDILIANAGYLADLSSIEAAEPAKWWKGFETNVLGNLNLLQAFLPLASMEKEKDDGKGAAIVHISTAAVHLQYLAGYSSYRASKIGATKAVRLRCC
jgi:NADP-dependent 3-hydroxy acid dehydrogenase YdfG